VASVQPGLHPIENFWSFVFRNMGQMEVKNVEDFND
jgi:hypothetical protein